MQQQQAALPCLQRFVFIADALNAAGGFAPTVRWEKVSDDGNITKPTAVSGYSYLVPYPRESMTKFAARAAVAVYENHLRSSCERFVGYLTSKPPRRERTDGPLVAAFLDDADWCGNALDVFWAGFMVEAKARGSMLLLMDMPAQLPATIMQQAEQRALPYITAIPPERLEAFELDATGRFVSATIRDRMTIGGEDRAVLREWNATGWRITDGPKVVSEGQHQFGRCPILAFTEYGKFPCNGNFQQIAELSRRIYNAQSELDEILRSQTFSLLTMQVPEKQMNFDPAKVAAVIGTHNMATYQGERPGFIAPPDGPATVYMSRIAGLEARIKLIGLEIEDGTASAAESGVAKAIRFQALNSALSSFATRMQDFERQVWDLFARGLGMKNNVQTTWATDYTLADPTAELDKLSLMQAGGFSDAILIEKRKQIVQADFSQVEQDELDRLLSSLDEPLAEPDPNSPGGATGTDPSTPTTSAGDPAQPGDPSTP